MRTTFRLLALALAIAIAGCSGSKPDKKAAQCPKQCQKQIPAETIQKPKVFY